MAVYKVPQDVEAEDKLIGPFSFRQFIYLIIVAIAIALGWFLSQIFIGLAILPLPIIIFFGALALPLRKDQSMEVYLAAMVKFYLKPKQRMWDPEGQFSRVTITAPTTEEQLRTKDFTRSEADERLSYLAQVIDTQGMAARGITTTSDYSLNPDIKIEAQSAADVFSDDEHISKKFSNLIEEQEEVRRQQTINKFQQEMQAPVTTEPLQPKTAQDYVTFPGQPKPDSFASLNAQSTTNQTSDATPVFNPYPQMRQRVISPSSQTPVQPAQSQNPTPTQAPAPQPPQNQTTPQNTNPTPVAAQPPTQAPSDPASQLPTPIQTSVTAPTPDIIRLASNNDLSIDAIAREAHRIEEKNNGGQEVVISLR